MVSWMPFDAFYEASSDGRIRKTGGAEIGQWERAGYMRARLSNPRRLVKVHRVIAGAFIPNPLDLPFVNHIDCDGTNNRVENLEWCDHDQNMRHMKMLGRGSKFWSERRTPIAALTDEQAEEVRRLHFGNGVPRKVLADQFSVSLGTIQRIVQGITYNRFPGAQR